MRIVSARRRWGTRIRRRLSQDCPIVCGVCFFVSAVMEIFIKIPFQKQASNSSLWKTVKADFNESIRFIRKEKPVIGKALLVTVSRRTRSTLCINKENTNMTVAVKKSNITITFLLFTRSATKSIAGADIYLPEKQVNLGRGKMNFTPSQRSCRAKG